MMRRRVGENVNRHVHARELTEIKLTHGETKRYARQSWWRKSPKDVATALVCIPSPTAAAGVPAEEVERRLGLHDAVAEALVATTPAVA